MNRRKIMLLGDIGVGKSSIVRRLVFDEFDHNYKPTLGVDVYSCEIAPDPPIDSPPAKFVVWDTDGNFGDSILSLVYIRQAAAALVGGAVSAGDCLDEAHALFRAVDGDQQHAARNRAVEHGVHEAALERTHYCVVVPVRPRHSGRRGLMP